MIRSVIGSVGSVVGTRIGSVIGKKGLGKSLEK